MFTGIVEELGRVRSSGARLSVAANLVAGDSAPGASVAVNGVCLTVVERGVAEDGSGLLEFDLSPETVGRTTLDRLAAGDEVNLERPVTLLGRLGGHLMQGHVDGIGVIKHIGEAGPGRNMSIELPDGLDRYLVEKGSIAVDGVSLTVTELGNDRFGVALVPYTLRATTLGTATVGDQVNLEVDILAKYVEGLLRERA
jgi:riboflavin synthase